MLPPPADEPVDSRALDEPLEVLPESPFAPVLSPTTTRSPALIAVHGTHLDEALGGQAGLDFHELAPPSRALHLDTRAAVGADRESGDGTVSTALPVLLTAIVSFTDAPTSCAGAVPGLISR